MKKFFGFICVVMFLFTLISVAYTNIGGASKFNLDGGLVLSERSAKDLNKHYKEVCKENGVPVFLKFTSSEVPTKEYLADHQVEGGIAMCYVTNAEALYVYTPDTAADENLAPIAVGLDGLTDAVDAVIKDYAKSHDEAKAAKTIKWLDWNGEFMSKTVRMFIFPFTILIAGLMLVFTNGGAPKAKKQPVKQQKATRSSW